MSNSLDPDQARQNVGPDMGPNCFQRLSAVNTSRQRLKIKSWFSKLNICCKKFDVQTSFETKIMRGVQYVMKTAQYIPVFYIYTLHNYFH